MSGTKDKMLIIDDHAQSIKKYSKLFSSSFLCLPASNGEDGLILFGSERPSIVLCDVKMPGGISGFEVCRKVKSISPEVIVVLISSYNNSPSRIEGFEARADDYISKMMSEEEVFFKVRNFYYTKKNIPALFFSKANNEVDLIDESFESCVRRMINDYYKNSLAFKNEKCMSLSFISEKMHKSCRSTQRDFSKKIGCTFSEFHNAVRLNVACDFLVESDRSVGEISEYLCYSSPSVFSREFKSMYGMTPSKYRSESFSR